MLHSSAPASTSAALVSSSSQKKIVSPRLSDIHHDKGQTGAIEQLRFMVAQWVRELWRATGSRLKRQCVWRFKAEL